MNIVNFPHEEEAEKLTLKEAVLECIEAANIEDNKEAKFILVADLGPDYVFCGNLANFAEVNVIGDVLKQTALAAIMAGEQV